MFDLLLPGEIGRVLNYSQKANESLSIRSLSNYLCSKSINCAANSGPLPVSSCLK